MISGDSVFQPYLSVTSGHDKHSQKKANKRADSQFVNFRRFTYELLRTGLWKLSHLDSLKCLTVAPGVERRDYKPLFHGALDMISAK